MTSRALGNYPMTIAQMGDWARQSSEFSVAQCEMLLQQLRRRTITKRKA